MYAETTTLGSAEGRNCFENKSLLGYYRCKATVSEKSEPSEAGVVLKTCLGSLGKASSRQGSYGKGCKELWVL